MTETERLYIDASDGGIVTASTHPGEISLQTCTDEDTGTDPVHVAIDDYSRFRRELLEMLDDAARTAGWDGPAPDGTR